ncbi:hypothetical protein EDC01DRAFT_716167 [Geopyxis carbonaria]|nr:hypothetical protein EDC01DRAFT_716167 [Geopyxis carbonaria]
MKLSILAVVFSSALMASATPLSPPLQCSVAQCDPNPLNNKCHITTSCINTQPNGQLHCACRAGYKAAAANYDSSKHYRTLFAGQEYRVFVKPGVKCDTLCDKYWLGPKSCEEVKIKPECS